MEEEIGTEKGTRNLSKGCEMEERRWAESTVRGGRLGRRSAGRNWLPRHVLQPVHFAKSAYPHHRPGLPSPQVSRAKHLHPGSVDFGQPWPKGSHPQHVRNTDTQGIRLLNHMASISVVA